ncbi:hypothetical protein, conserved, partial [Babesia bigemina]
MGFLSGVLDAVKDDDAVKTYDKDDDNNINTVIKKLQSQIGSGRDGLVASVDAVKGWLEGYDNFYKASTALITSHIDKLKTNIDDKYMKTVNSNRARPLAEQHESWKTSVTEMEQHIKSTDTAYIKAVDTCLQNKIKTDLKPILGAVVMLKKSSEHPDLRKQVKHLDEEFLKQQKILQESMFVKFSKIYKELGNLRDKKTLEIGCILDVVQASKQCAKQYYDKFDGTYTYEIRNTFYEIEGKLREINPTDEYIIGGDGSNSLFKRVVMDLRSGVEKIGKQLSVRSQELGNWKVVADSAVRAAKAKCEQILQIVYNEQGVTYTETGKHAEELKKKAKSLLRAYQSVQEKVEPLEGNIKRVLGVLEDKIREDLHTLKEAIKDDLNKVIQKLKQGIDAATRKEARAITAVQEFYEGLGGRDGVAPKLNAWAEQAMSSGSLKNAIQALEQHDKLFEKFQDILKQLDVNQNSIGKFYEVLTQDLDAKVDGQLPKESASKVRLDVLKAYAKEKNQKSIPKSQYQELLENVSHALDKYKDMPEFGDNRAQLTSGTILGAENAVNAHVEVITTQLNNVAGLVEQAKKKQLQRAGETDGVKEYLQDLEGMLRKSINAKLATEELKAHTIKGLQHINDELGTLNTTNVEGAKQAVDEVLAKVDELQKVPERVKQLRADTEILMDNIKHQFYTVEGTINNIGHTVEEANKSLTSAINSLDDVVRKAEKHLLTAVSQAFQSLTAAVRSLFAEQKKADLQALKGVVEEQKRVIEDIIDKDKRTGIKGLLKAVNGIKVTANANEIPTFNDRSPNLFDAIIQVAPPLTSKLTGEQYLQLFQQLSTKLYDYYNNVDTYINNQVTDPTKTVTSPPPTDQPTDPANQLTKIKSDFDNLLGHLQKNTKKYNYDNEFVKLRDHLTSSLTALSPSAFANPRHPELLDAVRSGLQGLVKEMERVYVNGYDDGTLINFTLNPLVKNDAGKNSGQNEKLTPYGEKLSKVCLTVVSNLHIAFKVLKKYCYTEQRFQKINKNTDVGMFFYHQGYDVSVKEKQKGELDKNVAATKIKKLLISDDYKHIYHTDKDTKLALQMLNEHLNDYYQVCHVSTFAAKKRPCNVFEILCWLSGLPCSSVYEEVLRDAVSELFEDPNKQVAADLDGFEITVTDMRDDFLPAHPNNMLYDDTRKAVMRLCSKSYDVLTRIVGYGNAHTMYAVDYCANSLNFHYPSKGEDCLQMLLDVLSRLYPPLRFLYRQCSIGAQHYGWADCVYGQNVPSAKWQCNEHPKDKATSQVGCLPTCQANTQPNCQPNSPLMSYLNDCLPGHLPHHVSSIGCRAVCSTCPKAKKGMPCLTPLGFRGFSGSEKTGRALCEMLENF